MKKHKHLKLKYIIAIAVIIFLLAGVVVAAIDAFKHSSGSKDWDYSRATVSLYTLDYTTKDIESVHNYYYNEDGQYICDYATDDYTYSVIEGDDKFVYLIDNEWLKELLERAEKTTYNGKELYTVNLQNYLYYISYCDEGYIDSIQVLHIDDEGAILKQYTYTISF